MSDLRGLIEDKISVAASAYHLEVVTIFPEDPPDTSCRPIRVRCSDGATWYLKGPHLGRIPVTEQVVARMAMLIGAPVPEIGVVRLGIVDGLALPSDVRPGLYHGSREIPNANVVYWVRPTRENQSDIAGLDVLFAWAESGDEQYLLDQDDRYYSFDHGAFLPCGRGSGWDMESLRDGPAPRRQEALMRAGVDLRFYGPVLDRLERLTANDVAEAVGMHPQDWECTVDERVALAEYFLSRREPVLRLFKEQS